MKRQKIQSDNRFKFVIFAILALILVSLPFLALGGKRYDLYVNEDASGEQDGSSEHPFETIAAAIDKAKDNTDIHVAKGEYKENITLKNGIRLFGEGKGKTVIKAKKDKWAVIFVEENSEINGFTIKGGKRGIWVDKYAETEIVDCIVKNNDEDGIGIEGGKDTKKRNAVLVSETEVKDNGKAGIYLSGKRRVTIMDSEITGNDGDGIDLAAGTSAWIEGNSIKNNSGSGMKATIDTSNIWTKSNSIRQNGREGVEVSYFGAAGQVDFSKSKIVDNGRYGIARVQRAGSDASAWSNYLTFNSRPINVIQYWGNVLGNISPVIFVR